MKLVALHGFLGQAQDFEPLKQNLNPEWSFIPDLFEKDQNLLRSGFADFVDQVIHHLTLHQKNSATPSEPFQLIGYSMGGRLALHLVLKRPDLFNRVILLSTHPGIFEPEESLARRAWEESWMEKINAKPWSAWTQEWLSQGLFSEDGTRVLEESNFSKEALLKSFKSFSNTKSGYSLEDFKALNHSLTWVVGEKDPKFLQLMKQVQNWRPNRDRHHVVAGAGHRLIASKDLAWLSALF